MVDTPNSTFDSSVPPLVFYYVATRTRCQFAAHRVFPTVFEVLDNLYRVLQIFSLFLLGQQMDGGVYRLIADLAGGPKDWGSSSQRDKMTLRHIRTSI